MSDSHMGETLRERREELGISLDMAATATNIRARVLQVIEEGDYANFPPYGHAIGMISSYARYLETDPRPILQDFEREWADFEAADRMATSAERTRRGVGRFGERAVQSERPSQRSAGASRAGEGREATGSMHAKLDDEKLAEEDDRYKSGTVRVVGHRQTGNMRRVGARPPRGGARSGERGRSTRTGDRRAGSAGRSLARGVADEGEPGRSGRLYDGRTPAAGGTGRSERERSGARTGSETSGREGFGSGRAAGTERGERPYSRYSRDNRRYSSRGTARSEGRSGRPGRQSGASRQSARPRTAASGTRARPGSGDAELTDVGTPNYFSVEKLDRMERDRAERDARAPRRQRAGDEASGDGGIVQRVVELVSDAFSERRTRVIAAGIAAFVLVVVIVAGVLISTAGNGDSGVIAVEGGAADTTKTTGDPNSASATVTTTNGNPVNVAIDVAAGQTSLINVTYDDDNAYSGTAVGAWHREFLVTESLEATFGNPDAVTVTENGNPVSIEKSDDGTGRMSLTIKTTSTSTTSGSATDSSGSKKSSKKKKKKSSTASSSSSSSSSS